MSTAAPANANAETAIQIAPATIASVAPLVQRLAAEVDAAEERVRALQTEAAKDFIGQQQRLMRFVAVADQIHAILLPRLEAFTTMNVFKDIKLSVGLETQGAEGRGFHGRTATLTVPYSDKRPAPMEFSFRVGHDVPMEQVVMDFRMEIRPVFIKFDDHDQLIVPIDQPDEEVVVAWIDDKLVDFTRTYFEAYFHDEYQKKSLTIDPVMNVRFPMAFAAATKVYQKRSYYFFTNESFEKFETDPAAYIEGTSNPPVEQTRADNEIEEFS